MQPRTPERAPEGPGAPPRRGPRSPGVCVPTPRGRPGGSLRACQDRTTPSCAASSTARPPRASIRSASRSPSGWPPRPGPGRGRARARRCRHRPAARTGRERRGRPAHELSRRSLPRGPRRTMMGRWRSAGSCPTVRGCPWRSRRCGTAWRPTASSTQPAAATATSSRRIPRDDAMVLADPAAVQEVFTGDPECCAPARRTSSCGRCSARATCSCSTAPPPAPAPAAAAAVPRRADAAYREMMRTSPTRDRRAGRPAPVRAVARCRRSRSR